jgi:hypothetical protein
MMRTLRFLTLATVVLLIGGAAALSAMPEKGNVDELRFGAMVDAEGVVPANSHATKLLASAPIHVTMKVQEAPKGAKLMLNVLDRETEELVLSQSKDLPGGHANMHFILSPGQLKPGKYRAKIKLVDDWVAEHEFQVE